MRAGVHKGPLRLSKPEWVGAWGGSTHHGVVQHQQEVEGETVGIQAEKAAWHALFVVVLLETKLQGRRVEG